MSDSLISYGLGNSAFSQLAAPHERIFFQEVTQANMLPTCCGTYTFHDDAGDLLYIGKAKNVRARVLSHLRYSKPHPSLRPWTYLIARIEVRFARSEMEALLVEADLVARLRPPFNRQMRSWSRYCYLVPTDDQANPLSISCQLQPWRLCFGPYRTRHQAVRIIEAIFCLMSRNGDPDMLAKCYGLLGGEDDSLVVDLKRQCQEMAANHQDERWTKLLSHTTAVLAKAFQRAVLLRNAKSMLGAIIVLPGSTAPRRVAVITDHGLHLDVIEPNDRDAKDFLTRYRKWIDEGYNVISLSLPKAVVDCLCVAASETTKHAKTCLFIPVEKASSLSAGELFARLYSERTAER